MSQAPEPVRAFIGFGEAAKAFAPEGSRAFDRKTDDPGLADAKKAEYARHKVIGAATNLEAIRDADVAICVVTADQALAAARESAAALRPGALYLDLNSVSPNAKRAARDVVEAERAHYVDVAVMAPVLPARLATPLLVSGPHGPTAVSALQAMGFSNVRTLDAPVGAASAIKMIRSVMVKGLEALTAECFLAAHAAGVTEEVRSSLNVGWPGIDWAAQADYNLERMLVHGRRRAAEMEEVVRTLEDLGVGSEMSRGAVTLQRDLGSVIADAAAIPEGLAIKIDTILNRGATTA